MAKSWWNLRFALLPNKVLRLDPNWWVWVLTNWGSTEQTTRQNLHGRECQQWICYCSSIPETCASDATLWGRCDEPVRTEREWFEDRHRRAFNIRYGSGGSLGPASYGRWCRRPGRNLVLSFYSRSRRGTPVDVLSIDNPNARRSSEE